MPKLFIQAKPVLEKIEQAGFQAYFVGGAVRDYLLNKQISDVDIATSATPAEIKEIFPKTVDVGIEHGTILVIFKGIPYEVTTFRTESEYADFRRPSRVEFIRSLEDDLKRRDFTMNAIAMNRNFTIIDPYLGKAAIENQQIRTVGRPEDRFQEDALRMMRAVRFVSQLSFSIERTTYQGLSDHGFLLEKIAVERILAEFNKLLAGENKTEAFKILRETGIYQFLPGFKGCGHVLAEYEGLDTAGLKELIENWTLLVHLLKPADIDSFLRSWKMSAKQMKQIKKYVFYLNRRLQGSLNKIDMFHAGLETTLSLEKIFCVLTECPEEAHDTDQIESVYQSLPIHALKELAVDGNDLIQWSARKAGPWIKEVLLFALEGVLEQKAANEKEAIREWLCRCNLI
ncbi:tRNA nucleotidyltransferase (CCA-adding enzyme) [Peribacillus deserti]|uniref:CCA-adding enzyme n=1 Tax=Peribacillus deserti TaxID=673318 RepID=A0ABS2QK13_9BACI|nr:CCA tRNA nucleotidyltransferase [Peribacillus deserti]MBM7692621.1 tRNA nucleotidyltransferase (CCA-adding enzyme) [Peribacillus deserti]